TAWRPPRTTELLTVGLLQPRQARRWHIRGGDCPSHGPEEADRRAGGVARKGTIGNHALVPLWTTRLTEPHTPGTAVAPDSHAYGAFLQPRRRKKHPIPGHVRKPGGVGGTGTDFA